MLIVGPFEKPGLRAMFESIVLCCTIINIVLVCISCEFDCEQLLPKSLDMCAILLTHSLIN